MKDTLKQLQQYQIDALEKGISFDINAYVVSEANPDITVRMSYAATDPVYDTRTFCTTFSNDVDEKVCKMLMGRIRKFINDIETNE